MFLVFTSIKNIIKLLFLCFANFCKDDSIRDKSCARCKCAQCRHAPAGEPRELHVRYLVSMFYHCIIVCVCDAVSVYVFVQDGEKASVFREQNLACFWAPTDWVLSSPTAAAATIPALPHLSQRAHEEDSGSTHICFRSSTICCKCVCDGRPWVSHQLCLRAYGVKREWKQDVCDL